MGRLGCRFLVAGRADGEGQFVGLEANGLPAGLSHLFEAIAENEYRRDVSSTGLRALATR